MANLLSRISGKPFYLLVLSGVFLSACSSDDNSTVVVPEPVNSPPVVTSAVTDTATADAAYTYLLTATDADGDALTYQASILPSWLSFNSASAELSGTPSRADAGDYQITLAATDGMNATPLFLSLSVVIANSAPSITSKANNNGVVGSNYSYSLAANDIDGDMITTSLVSTLPAWASFDALTSTVSGTPDATGDVEVELSVSDGILASKQKFTLVVTTVPAVVLGFDEAVVFSDFAGAVTDIITNPDATGINTSDNVGRMQKFAGEVFAGTTIDLDDPITLNANNVFTVKVWSQRQVALTFKLEGDVDANDVERVVTHDGTGWEELSIDFTDVTGSGYTAITLIFENGVNGDAANDAVNWTFYLDDLVIPFVTDGNGDGNTPGPEMVVNGGFDAGFASWTEIGAIVMEGNNNIFQADVQAAGNPWDVSFNQVVALAPDTDYILTFKAKASVARTMIAGLGLNYDPWTSADETISLTTDWVTYTVNLTTTGFGDANNRIIFDMGAEVGIVSIDDVSLTLASVDGGDDTTGPELTVNGGFDAGFASWTEIGAIVMEGNNNIFQADVQAAGNPWDVSFNQVVALAPDSEYILTFKAKASLARTMIAGVGLNYDPWTSADETISLSTDWVTYTLNLTTTGFGDANNRIIFDMGAEVGIVSIDDVSLKLVIVNDDNTDDDALTTNGDFEAGDLSGWSVSENGGSIAAVNNQDNGGAWIAQVVAGTSNNPAFSQEGLAVGTVMPGDTIDISFDMCGTAASGGVIFPALLSEFGGDNGADRQTLATIAAPPSVWTRYNYSAVAGNNVTGGVSLQLDVVCGGDAACSADVYFDNVSVTIGGGPVAGDASGNSCVADNNGNDNDPTAGLSNDFEGPSDSYTFSDFNGGQVTIIANPDVSGINTSAQVGQMIKFEEEVYGGSTLTLENAVDISAGTVTTMKVWSQRAVAVLFKLEGGPIGEVSVNHTGSGWEELSFDFGDLAGTGVTGVTLIFDNGTQGDAANNPTDWTFYFDDIVIPATTDNDDPDPAPEQDLAVELVVFETLAQPEWAAWTDGRGPTEVLQDGDYGGVTKFTLTDPTVAGFTSRDGGGAVNGMTFDASTLVNGMIRFDFKMVKEPNAGLVDWKLKVESSTGGAAEVNLSTSVEGHATPLIDTWQSYSFPISALVEAGLDAINIDLFMVFPDYNSAAGAEFYLDNFRITSGGEVPSGNSPSMSGGDAIVDVAVGINFEGSEADQTSWDVFENGTNPGLEFVANPDMTGNTSAGVAKITLEAAEANSGKFAGTVTRTVQEFELNASNAIVKIWVYKDKISPVGIKFEKFNGDGYGSHGELTVSNTKINEWEQLTIDFSGEIGRPENDAISGIAIFPDMLDGRAATVAYFDEITFTAN